MRDWVDSLSLWFISIGWYHICTSLFDKLFKREPTKVSFTEGSILFTIGIIFGVVHYIMNKKRK